MKKTILICALVLVAGISSSFAENGAGINSAVKTAFQRDFANAREVNWETRYAFVKVTFSIENQVAYAYYTMDGDLMAVTRNILSNQLPVNRLVYLSKHFKDYWISDLFEMNSNGETSYYITLENADNRMVLRSVGNGEWELYKKESKP